MKVVKSCDSQFDAALVQGRLANYGIDSCILNEYSPSMIPYGQSFGALQIQIAVSDENFQGACELLLENPDVVKCPECGSTNFEFSFAGMSARRRFLLRYLMFPIALLSGTAIGPAKRTYVCGECGHLF